jgi:putative lipoprotein
MATIQGSILYRERMMLRPGSQLQVDLEDVSLADAPAVILASKTWPAEGAPPYSFVLAYDPADVVAGRRYGIRGRITNGDRLLFISDTHIDPFAGSPVEVMVRMVPASKTPPGPGLEGTTWVLATLDGEPAGTGADGRAPDISFEAEAGRAAGFSGCNRFSGGYSREGSSEHGAALSFGNMMSTMMACAEGMELEREFLQMLGKVTAFVIREGSLVLLAGPQELATFAPAE